MFSEKQFEDILVKYPDLIEKDLKFIGRQVPYFGKRIDILFEDRFNEKLIVELKKDNLDRNALSQVLEYEGYILSEKDPTARVMIIANRIPLNLKKAMDHHGIEYKEITLRFLTEFLEKNNDNLETEQPVRKKEEKTFIPMTNSTVLLNPLTSNSLQQSVIFFRQRIKSELHYTGKRALAFPGGERGEGDNFEIQTKCGLLSITVIADDNRLNRFLHFVTLNQASKTPASDIEINIPKGYDPRVSTLLAVGNGNRYICNRGKFTVYMKAIKKSVALNYFADRFNNVTGLMENGKVNSVIQFANLDSATLFEQIASFTEQIKNFKAQYREK
jgi:hypothetical protein